MKRSSAEHDAAVEAMRTVAKANKGKVCLLAFLFHLNFVMLCMLVKLRLDDYLYYVMLVTIVATGLYYLFVEFRGCSTQTIYKCLLARVEGC